MKKPSTSVVILLPPSVEPHDDPERVIGRRTTYCGKQMPFLRQAELIIVAVLKLVPGTHGAEEYARLESDQGIRAAGGVKAGDRIEVAPFIPGEGRLSFATSDPRAIDLDAFRHLA